MFTLLVHYKSWASLLLSDFSTNQQVLLLLLDRNKGLEISRIRFREVKE